MTDFSRISTVTSFSPAPVTLDAIRRIVREELQANAALEAAARQALEALEWHLERGAWGADIEGVTGALRAVLKEKA